MEHIIIDVSGCKFYNAGDETCRELNGKYDIVENCDFDKCMYFNCYFKQLKRKEKECEEWKNKLAKSFADERKKEMFIDQLKEENEELKKTVDDLLHKPEIQDKILWKIDNEKLLLSKDTWIYKLEKTLTEIKDIADKFCRTLVLPNGIAFSVPEIEQIIQKCKEVQE